MIGYITLYTIKFVYNGLQGYFVHKIRIYIGANWYFFGKVLIGTFFCINLYLRLRSPPQSIWIKKIWIDWRNNKWL